MILTLLLEPSSDPSSTLRDTLIRQCPSYRFAWNATDPLTLSYSLKTGHRGRPRWCTVDIPTDLCEYLFGRRDSVQCEIEVKEET